VLTSIKAACLAPALTSAAYALHIDSAGHIMSAQISVPSAALPPGGSCSTSHALQALQVCVARMPAQRSRHGYMTPNDPHTRTNKHLHQSAVPCLTFVVCLSVLQRLSASDLSGVKTVDVAVHTPRAGPAVPKPPEAATPDLSAAAGEGVM
jgi:hypothetical protein